MSDELSRRDALRAAAVLAGGAIVSLGGSVIGCSPQRPDAARLGRRARARAASPNARPALTPARQAVDGRGARVSRLFPSHGGDHRDPFVLLDHFHVGAPAGFPIHPHRGFEAFTYMLDGSFHHRDTMGNDSVVHTGGTQRFTSGRGARHSEMPVGSGVNHGLQLWVNLPAELKRIDPEYAAVQGADIPEEGGRGLVTRTVVGRGSPVHLRTRVRYLDIRAEPSATFETEVPAGSKGLLYVVEGHVRVGDVLVAAHHAAELAPGELGVAAEERARFVYLEGQQQNQPIRHWGPYVD